MLNPNLWRIKKKVYYMNFKLIVAYNFLCFKFM